MDLSSSWMVMYRADPTMGPGGSIGPRQKFERGGKLTARIFTSIFVCRRAPISTHQSGAPCSSLASCAGWGQQKEMGLLDVTSSVSPPRPGGRMVHSSERGLRLHMGHKTAAAPGLSLESTATHSASSRPPIQFAKWRGGGRLEVS